MRTLLGTLALFALITGCSDNGNDVGTELPRGGATGGRSSSTAGSGSEDGPRAGSAGIQSTGGAVGKGGSDIGGTAGEATTSTGGTEEGGASSGASCEYEGEIYQHGASWACDCNTCRCLDGEVASTLIGCEEGTAGSTGSAGAGGDDVSATGGSATGGAAAGGESAGGTSAGGTATGGASTGGASTGGASGGDTCTSDLYCGDNEYCYREVYECTGTGVCAPLAEGCIAVFDPVCGCDGNTYGNGCEAATHGISVRFTGTCEDAVHCGGNLGDTCAEDEYCDYVPSQQCGITDATAVCQKRPETCGAEYAPVCGCDGETHSNACVAHGAGTGIMHTGEC